MKAYLVSVKTQDGLQLDGALKGPSRRRARPLGVDGVILVHGNGGNFYNASMFDQYGDALAAQGCAALRVNTRAHDMISYTTGNADYKRIGTTYEVIDECRLDLKAWVDYLRSEGYERIALWGHSLGAVKSIYYMAQDGDPNVRCVVAASPPRFSYSRFAQMTEGQEFLKALAQMQRLVEEGKAKAILDVTVPYTYVATPQQYIEKYGAEERYNILSYLPKVRCPILITIGTAEAQAQMTFRGLPEDVQRIVEKHRHMAFASISGGDHFYTNQRDHVWKVVSQWLEKV